jgi:hypothetical protein
VNADLSKLFEERPCEATSCDELETFLESYRQLRLEYPAKGNRNSGYIFRGEIGFPIPLQSSLERNWLKSNQGPAAKLLEHEKHLVEEFMRDAQRIFDLAKEHKDERPRLPCQSDVFEWLQLKQHYRTGTRFLDFTTNIYIALYFALEHYCKTKDRKCREGGLQIYCLPCVDEDWQKNCTDNKTPFCIKDGPININVALGIQTRLNWGENWMMSEDARKLKARHYRDMQKQNFGWDRAYHTNPRLSFQQGMLAYPYETENVTIAEDKPSWFVQCLQMNQADPFHLGATMKKQLPPCIIRIPLKAFGNALKYIQDCCELTPAKVYLDYGRIGERLKPE